MGPWKIARLLLFNSALQPFLILDIIRTWVLVGKDGSMWTVVVNVLTLCTGFLFFVHYKTLLPGIRQWFFPWNSAQTWTRLCRRLSDAHIAVITYSRHWCYLREEQSAIQFGISVAAVVRTLNCLRDFRHFNCRMLLCHNGGKLWIQSFPLPPPKLVALPRLETPV